MTSLSFLNLSNNAFNSSIPNEFWKLSLLTDLDLHSNNLSGSLEAVFTKGSVFPFGLYTFIDLSYNNFAGPIQEDIGDQPVMFFVESLTLSENPLGGEIPKSMGNLIELQVLRLVGNGLSGTIPSELGGAVHLTTILLSNNNLSGGIPSGVLNLEEIEDFDISGNHLSGMIPPHKAVLPVSAFKNNPGLCGSPLPPC